MLLNLRAMANARAGNDPATTQPMSVVIPVQFAGSADDPSGESSPHWATFDLTSGRLTSIQVTFDFDHSQVAGSSLGRID